jgi:hypothetical protein
MRIRLAVVAATTAVALLAPLAVASASTGPATPARPDHKCSASISLIEHHCGK